jgi:rhodanese-related sulfurtransferase
MSGIKGEIDRNLTAAEALKFIEDHKDDDDLVILDVRTPWEFSKGSISGAKNLDFTDPDFENMVSELDKNKTYIVYCKTGKRSGMVEQFLKEHGFYDIYIILGGFEDFKKELQK